MKIVSKSSLILGFILFAFIVVWTGCGSGEASLEQPTNPIASDKLFPLSDGNSWTYKRHFTLGRGSPDITSDRFVVKTASMPDGQSGFDIYDPGKGALNWISILNATRSGNIVSFSGFIGASKTGFNPPLIILPQTLTAGAEWLWNGEITGRNSASATIKNKFEGMEEVKVPAGTYKCVRIYRMFDEKIKVWHWYSSGVGLVKVKVSRTSAGALPASEDLYELESFNIPAK
jgi:hypothetical protein